MCNINEPTTCFHFSPIQGLWTRSVRLSVCPSGNTITLLKLNESSWNFLHIFLKPNQELSSKMGKIRKKIFMSWVPHRNQYWVYGAKKKFCLIDLKFGTLVFWVNRNDFWKNYKNRLKNKEIVAAQSFKMAQMAARLPQAERGVWGAEPPTNKKLIKFKL